MDTELTVSLVSSLITIVSLLALFVCYLRFFPVGKIRWARVLYFYEALLFLSLVYVFQVGLAFVFPVLLATIIYVLAFVKSIGGEKFRKLILTILTALVLLGIGYLSSYQVERAVVNSPLFWKQVSCRRLNRKNCLNRPDCEYVEIPLYVGMYGPPLPPLGSCHPKGWLDERFRK
ncbi:hypothetical protein B5M47_03360 [candidate division CPR3 bacterium 4484_211]|uniref:Uncharacterized protein n=1 Tax=candidate division CPR3 bacterium 4484_211 TaxID=1968527 RepID=A0A1W9NX53_UNCC3|nr:MAG: hypothetical protein B5M47_03360 [candidate division CPR3 bacterium 4484_211]